MLEKTWCSFDGMMKYMRKYEKKIRMAVREKHLTFDSHQIQHIMQCGTNLHKAILLCRLKFPNQEVNNSKTLCSITQWIPNKLNTTIHNSYAIWQWRRRWSTNFPHLLHIQHQSITIIFHFWRLSKVKILP